MDWYSAVKTVHIISATVLFGTGLGTAFFMLRSYFTDTIQAKSYASRNTVLADYLFTLPAGIIQPVSGAWLVWQGGYDPTEFWLMLTYGLYMVAGLCWLPVVWIQIKLNQMVIKCAETGADLPPDYQKLFKIWFLLGWPAFIGLTAIFYMMVAKPL